jgi:hypothetical protein
MWRGVRWYLVGFLGLGLLGVLAGCSGSYFAEREAWRHEAEVQCLNSGAIHEDTGKVRIKAINGPGMCGADYPLKVSALGERGALGYSDELRPPGSIPSGSSGTPRWPVNTARPSPTPAYEPNYSPGPTNSSAVESQALPRPRHNPSRYEQPLPLELPDAQGPTYQPYDFRKPYGASKSMPEATPRAHNSSPYDLSPVPYESRRSMGNVDQERRPDPGVERSPPSLGPAREQVAAAAGPVGLKPAATLACPLVSALDQWISEAVQPAAMHWFGQPVVEIRQISAYSCRGMNGDPNAHISEHAFGNALDIAGFTLADGYKFSVEKGWHGRPEEQGFLRDVEASACSQFTTVLAPGSNRFHYNHIHVDLMRRRGGRRACNPRPVSGEQVAARARAAYAARHGGDPSYTGSLGKHRKTSSRRLEPSAYAEEPRTPDLPLAQPGADGED